MDRRSYADRKSYLVPILPSTTSLYNVNRFGIGGLNTFDNPKDIQDIELVDLRNMIFDNGILYPRRGSLLYLAKPAGETHNPTQMLVATGSTGVDYMITVYGNNFYLADTINTQWIKLNQAYTPHILDLFYGSSNWNKGLSDDRFYFGNGSENTMKWVMAVTSLSVAALSAHTKLYVDSSMQFVGNPANVFATETAVTIAFVHATHQITDSGNGFLTAGFRSGDSIKISGSVSNDGIYTIYSVTAGVIVVKEPVTDEAAGNSITIAEIGIALVMNAGTPFTLYYTSVDTSYTASTISFTSPHTITDSAAGFVAAGFQAGQTIYIGGTLLNNGKFTIVSVTTTTIIVTEIIDTEAAGEPVTITTPSLNLNGTVGQNVPVGSTVTTPIIDMGAMPKGKVLTVSQGNLFLANYLGSENTINFSRLGDPENFTITTADAKTAGFYVVYHGKGGIIDMKDFGQYLLIEKQDILLQWIFSISSGGDLIVTVGPIIAGDGIGPVSNANTLNYMNTLYYPTTKQGILTFSPHTTGSQTSSGLSVLSQSINNIVVDVLDFTKSRTCGLAQKLYWAVSLPTVGVTTNVNNLVLMFDLVRAAKNPNQSAWTVFDNWNAVDIKPVNNVLYYFSLSDGAVYQCYSGYQDAIDANPTPYVAMALSKRFNFDSPATLNRIQYVYLEGLISLNTTFYAQILDNEKGSLGTQTYRISGNNRTITSNAFSGGLGRFILGSAVLGGVDLPTLQELQKPLFFRVYLETSQAFRPHNIQVRAFSTEMGSQWGISCMTVAMQPENSIETALVLSPSAAPMLTIPNLSSL